VTRSSIAALSRSIRRLAFQRPPRTMAEAHRRYRTHPPRTLAEALALFAPWRGLNIPFRFAKPNEKPKH